MSYIGNQPTSVAFVTDSFSGNGTTTAFTMSVAPANTASVLVAISGVLQDPSTYSVSGNTLTFTAAPPTGTGNISARFLGVPASNVTTTAYRTVTEFTATASQTTFTPPSYTAGFINVYRNGVLLGSTDYTATNGTTVVLASGAAAGDLITVESFLVSSVLNAIPATAGSVGTTYIAGGAVSLTTQVSGTLPIANGGTGLTSAGSSGQVVTSTGSAFSLGSALVSGTAQASTSGTSIDFTGIPSWVKRITLAFYGVSTNGTSIVQVQIGSGSFTTTGYGGSVSFIASGTAGSTAVTTGFGVSNSNAAADARNGTIVLTNLGSNTWVSSSVMGLSTASNIGFGAGSIALAGTLDRVRITTVNGTDTFDAGSINILYE